MGGARIFGGFICHDGYYFRHYAVGPQMTSGSESACRNLNLF